MKLRYFILISSILLIGILFLTSIFAINLSPDKLFNLGGVTYSPFNTKTSNKLTQSIFISQEGTHNRLPGLRVNSSSSIKISGVPDTSNTSSISGIPDSEPNLNYPPIKYSDKMYGDIGYVPGTKPEELFKEFKMKYPNSKDPVLGSTVYNIWNTLPLEGSYHIPVLLVDFADYAHTLDKSIFEDQFNDNVYLDGNGTSVRKYYYTQSYGKLNITYDIYEWRTLSAHPYTWYGTGNNAFQFLLDTMELYGTGPNAIDFTQYDYDNDGRIDGVVMLHAGLAGEEAGSGNIRSQARIFAQSQNYSIQGIYYGNVAIVNELVVPMECNNYINSFSYPTDCRSPVLTTTHELGHVLGIPDLYQLGPAGNQLGTGLHDLTMMAQQDWYPQRPVSLDAWSRYFLGWVTATEIEPEMYGNYSINRIDTNSEAAYILRDESKMNPREYFLVTNRYVSQSNQDKWLFLGVMPGQLVNLNGGLEILHVDESYIESQYPTNTVMYDVDQNMYNDTISHPGIVFEQNSLSDGSNNQVQGYIDLYTTEWEAYFSYIPNFGTFDNIERIDPSNLVFWDTTSRSYNGLQDTAVKVQTLSAGGDYVLAYLQSAYPPLAVEITNPVSNHSYQRNDVIDFNETHIGNTGEVSCIWSKAGDAVISTSCSFSASPHSFGINSTGCSGTTPITLVLTDLNTDEQVTDVVNIKVYGNVQEMCKTTNISIYAVD